MSHFNRFNDRRIVDALLKTCGTQNAAASTTAHPTVPSNVPTNAEPVIDCIEWNDLGYGWSNAAPFPNCLVPRSSKYLFTEENLESVIAQRILAASNEASTNVTEETKPNASVPRRSFAAARSDPWNVGQRVRPTNAVLSLKEARLQPCNDVLSSRETLPQQLTPQQKRLQREIQRDLRKREMEVEKVKTTENNTPPSDNVPASANVVESSQKREVPVAPVVTRHVPSVTPRLMMATVPDSELILPPIDIPLVSLSFNYDRLNEKMNWWDEEIRKDIQTKADARNRAKLETLMDSEEGTIGGDIFSIKSILHTCNYECDCNKYPERQNKLFETSVTTAMLTANRDQGGKLKSRYATNVALRRVSRGSAVSQRRTSTSNGYVSWTSTANLPLSAVSSSSGTRMITNGNSDNSRDRKESAEGTKPQQNINGEGSVVAGTGNGANGFCSNALGQPKIREAKSIPSIPTDCDASKTVTLTGKRLQVAVPR